MKISKLLKDKTLLNKLFPYSNDEFLHIDPTNNKLLKRYEYDSKEILSKKLKNSQNSFLSWKFASK